MNKQLFVSKNSINWLGFFVFVLSYGAINIVAERYEAVIFLFIPYLAVLMLYLFKRKKLTDYGICKGEYKNRLAIFNISAIILFTLINFVLRTFVFNGIATITLLMIVSLVAAAFCEELLFRGVLLKYLFNRINAFEAVLVSSAAFALLHIVNVRFENAVQTALQILFAFSVGMCFGVIRYATKSIVLPFIFHLLINISSGDAFTVNIGYYYLIASIIILLLSATSIIIWERKNETVH